MYAPASLAALHCLPPSARADTGFFQSFCNTLISSQRNPEWRVEGGEGVNANPVPVESDTATDADEDAAGAAAAGGGGSFNFNQTQEEVEAILAQQAAKDAEVAAAQAEGFVFYSPSLPILNSYFVQAFVASCVGAH